MSALSRDETAMTAVPGAIVDLHDGAAAAAPSLALPRRRGFGLAGRLLLLTISFVLLTMTLWYTSRLSAYRDNWLRDRLMVAHTAMLLFGETDEGTLPTGLAAKILGSVGAKAIVVTLPDGRRLAATSGAETPVVETDEVGGQSGRFPHPVRRATLADSHHRPHAERRRARRHHARPNSPH
jgi:hypothetical protein